MSLALPIISPLSRITTMGGVCVHRSGSVTELRLECGDGIRVDAGFGKRVPLRYCSYKKTNVYTEQYVTGLDCSLLGAIGNALYESTERSLHRPTYGVRLLLKLQSN